MSISLCLIVLLSGAILVAQEQVKIIEKKGRYGLKYQGKTVLKAEYERIAPVLGIEGLYYYMLDGRYGVLFPSEKVSGQVSLPYEEILSFDNLDFPPCVKQDGTWYLLSASRRTYDGRDQVGFVAIEQCDSIVPMAMWGKGYIATYKEGKVGLSRYYRNESHRLVETKYDSIVCQTKLGGGNDLFHVRLNDKWGFVRVVADGAYMSECKYDKINAPTLNRYGDILGFYVTRDGYSSFTDKYGVELLPLSYKNILVDTTATIDEFKDREISVFDGSKWGVFASGREVLPCKYPSKLKRLMSDFYQCEEEGKVRIVRKGELLPQKYDSIVPSRNDANVCYSYIGGKQGGLKGAAIVPCEYDSVFFYKDDALGADLWKNGKVGYQNSKGEVIPASYKSIGIWDWYATTNGVMENLVVAEVGNGSLDLYRESDCKLILKGNPAIFTGVKTLGGFLVLSKNEKYGLATNDGKVVVMPRYGKVVAKGAGVIAFMNMINYNEGTLYIHRVSDGKLLGKELVSTSRPYHLRSVMESYGLYQALF